MTTSRHVLVIDGPAETATVLQAVLEPRGTLVHRTRTHGLDRSSRAAAPDVVVIDADEREESPRPKSDSWRSAPRVVITSDRILVDDTQTRFLQKPYQFPDLIRAVEDLLATADQRATRD